MRLNAAKQSARLVVVVTLFLFYTAGVFLMGSSLGKTKVDSKRATESSESLSAPTPQENIQSAQVLASSVKLCASTNYSFEIAYPDDWFTTFSQPENQCLYFAPYSFVLPNFPGDNFTPISVKVIAKDEWETTAESFKQPTELYSVVTYNNIEVNGKPAKYIEAISTGNTHPKGYLKLTYLIHDADTPLEITYLQSSQEEETVKFKEILTEMANSTRFF